MKTHCYGILIGFTLLASLGKASAQTVQLPQFRFFSTTSTVNVPDQGQAFLGGVKRYNTERNEEGVPILGKVPMLGRLFRNTGIGKEVSSSAASVTATIIDIHAMDEEILGKVAAADARADSVLRLARSTERDLRADFLSRHVGKPSDVVRRPSEAPIAEASRLPSLEDIRRENDAAGRRRQAEAVAYLEKAKDLEAAGKAGVAKIYYSMAARQATGDLKAAATARLQALQSGRANVASRK